MSESITQFKSDLPQTDDFKSIILNRTPLIDVRAPVEFHQGAFDTASNLPLMNDEERQKVGICYKQHGNETAVKLGHKLVSGSVKENRVQSWMNYMDQHPDAMLYCFRGGMRSKIAQQWLQDNGREIVRLKGGYKAFRRYLIDFLGSLPNQLTQSNIQPLVLAGRTGSGKTLLLNQLENKIDLEGLANHRGSAFGRHATPQPTQIDFENNLAMAMIRFLATGLKQLIIEDEGQNIGSVNLPKPLHEHLKSGRHIVLETAFEERVHITFDEYVTQAQQEYDSVDTWQNFMTAAFSRIRKRLGGERYQRIIKQFDLAMQQQASQNDASAHQSWIRTLLFEYYDPMYDYQIKQKAQKIAFKGTRQEIMDYLNSL